MPNELVTRYLELANVTDTKVNTNEFCRLLLILDARDSDSLSKQCYELYIHKESHLADHNSPEFINAFNAALAFKKCFDGWPSDALQNKKTKAQQEYQRGGIDNVNY